MGTPPHHKINAQPSDSANTDKTARDEGVSNL
jgi:hypothetical protein